MPPRFAIKSEQLDTFKVLKDIIDLLYKSAVAEVLGEWRNCTLEDFKYHHVKRVIREEGGNRLKASQRLGITPKTLRRILVRMEGPNAVQKRKTKTLPVDVPSQDCQALERQGEAQEE